MAVLSKIILFIAGIIGLLVGIASTFLPVTFYSSAHILPDNIYLLSEIRAAGAVLLIGSVFIIWGAIRQTQKKQALFIACLLYLSYGIGRVISIALDGQPPVEIMLIMALEFIIGGLCFWLLNHQSTTTL